MPILMQLRPDMTERDQISHLKEQLEVYLNGQESITREEIDALIKRVLNGELPDAMSLNPGGGSGGGGGGVTNYPALTNKPQIEGVTLVGDLTFEDLTLRGLSNIEIEDLITNAE